MLVALLLSTFASPLKSIEVIDELEYIKGEQLYSHKVCVSKWYFMFLGHCKVAKFYVDSSQLADYIASSSSQSQLGNDYFGSRPNNLIDLVLQNGDQLKEPWASKAEEIGRSMKFDAEQCPAAMKQKKENEEKLLGQSLKGVNAMMRANNISSSRLCVSAIVTRQDNGELKVTIDGLSVKDANVVPNPQSDIVDDPIAVDDDQKDYVDPYYKSAAETDF